MVPASIFRAYDIRGIVGDTLTEEGVFYIGKALASMVREAGETQLIVARDGRLSGPLLSKALCEGILSVGCDVLDLGMVPTPVLYYAADVFAGHSGVMLTGSHNPSNYNGLKMVVKGQTLAEEAIQALYQRIIKNDFYANGHGVRCDVDLIKQYMDHICRDVQLARPLKVVIDAGNGVTGMMAPALFRALGCEVIELFCDVDGHFPNHHPDPSQPENIEDLIKAVRASHADVGLAFDGDGDRLGVVTNEGEIIWPDRLLMLYAEALLRRRPQAKIIYDVKCTHHLETHVKHHGGVPMMWKTGHSLIKAKMKETKAQLAGEMSGHFFFKDRWHGGDDALYAGARLLEILAEQYEDSASVFAAIPNSINTPELKIFVDEHEKFGLMQALIDCANFKDSHQLMTIDGLRVNFAEGWGLVRPSNTSPYLVLRFEAMNQAILEKIQDVFKDWMLTVKSDLVFPY